MWKISKQSFGFVLTFASPMSAQDMQAWVTESKQVLSEPLPGEWGVVVDMRELSALTAEAQKLMQTGQALYKQAGMKRSAVAVRDAVTAMQFRRLARNSGIDQWERYINVQQVAQWQSAAKRWVVEGSEPPQ